MRKTIFLLLCLILFCPLSVMARLKAEQKIILLESAREGENIGLLEKSAEGEQISMPVQLVGQARMIKSMDNPHTIVQMVWVGVRKSEEQHQQVAFQKPLVSTFKVKNLNQTKGIILSVDDEMDILQKAIEQLKDGNIDKDDIKKKMVAKNPRKKGRFVEVEKKKDNTETIALNGKKSEILNDDPSFASDDALTDTPSSSFSEGARSETKKSGSSAMMPREGSGTFATSQSIPLSNQPLSASPRQEKEKHEVNPVIDPALNLKELELETDDVEPEVDEYPVATVEITEAGCQPRLDRVHERVIIQNRVRKFENGIVVDEGQCTDSLEMYPVMKDYLCSNCTDIVEPLEAKAYSQYQEFWFNRDNQRVLLEETLYTDKARPYHFRDEAGECEIEIDLVAREAYKQVETVYFNFNHIRKVVTECHRAPNITPIPLNETTKGCPIIHDFVNNVSYEQNRIIYMVDGAQREARSCETINPPLPHEFVTLSCQPIVDFETKIITKTARRRIKTAKGLKVITEECEPEGNSSLQATREGCEGEYFHDFNLRRSYLKKRYFFTRENEQRDYVIPCIRSQDFVGMKTKHDGTYEHDDNARISSQMLSLYLDTTEQGLLFLDVARPRPLLGKIPYTLQKNEHREVKADYYFEGCYRRTKSRSVNIYHRADGSIYDHDIGAGNSVKSAINECKSAPEYRNHVVGREKGKWSRHGRDITERQVRTATTYPDGHVEHSSWTKAPHGFH